MQTSPAATLARLGLCLLCVISGCGLTQAQPASAADTRPSTQPSTRPSIRPVGTLEHPAIQECSGIVASRKHPGVYWVHNDSGHEPALFAVTREGKLIAEFTVAALNRDWEDIATDSDGNLYIGDIGNNGGVYRQLMVHQLDEPDPRALRGQGGQGGSAPRLPVLRTWTLEFPNQPFDCEALFVHERFGYVISKLFLAGRATLYRFPLDAPAGTPITLEKVTALPIFAPVTAADIRSDGRRLAVLSVAGLSLFTIEKDFTELAKSTPIYLRHFQYNAEAVCFEPDGGVLIATEARELFSAQPPQPEQADR